MSSLVHSFTRVLIFFILPFVGVGPICFGQIKISCCGIDQIIPHFADDSLFHRHFNVLEQVKFLTPIDQSKSPIELRIYDASGTSFTYSVIVAKCMNDTFTVVKYYYKYGMAPDQEHNFTYVGLVRNRRIGVRQEVLKTSIRKDSLNFLFKLLIDNHLYDIPDEDGIASTIKKKHPNIVTNGGDDWTSIELKVGAHCRSIYYSSIEYDPEPNDVDVYNYQLSVLSLLNRFTKK